MLVRFETAKDKIEAMSIEELSSTIKSLDRVRMKLKEARKKKQEQEKLCIICYDQPKNHAIVDCGHRFCSNCLKKCQRCPLCNGPIIKTIPIF